MSSVLVHRPYSDLGWRWRVVDGSRVAHLVPARLGPLSRSACHRLSVQAEDQLEEPVGLLTHMARCEPCERADS